MNDSDSETATTISETDSVENNNENANFYKTKLCSRYEVSLWLRIFDCIPWIYLLFHPISTKLTALKLLLIISSFQSGNCPFLDNCHFAHGKKDLRKAMCKFGTRCRNRSSCWYEHPKEEEETSASPSTGTKQITRYSVTHLPSGYRVAFFGELHWV